jgi:hypothetical protein
MNNNHRKLSGGDILVAVLLIGVLSLVATVNFSRFTPNAPDAIARNDYDNIKSELLRKAEKADFPKRVFINRHGGPGNLPAPLAALGVHKDVEATVLRTVSRRGNKPSTLTRLEVFHRNGKLKYEYAETNGIVQESVTDRQAH